jgi:triphosphoribosyl-dephospho-CoA synthetase
VLLALANWSYPAPPLDEDQGRILVEAVESATAIDLYNARCRSDNSGRFMDNLNKALVGRLRMTVITIQDDLFPERGFRQAQRRMQEQFQETLSQAGGCKGAKESGLPERMQARHRELLEAIDAMP